MNTNNKIMFKAADVFSAIENKLIDSMKDKLVYVGKIGKIGVEIIDGSNITVWITVTEDGVVIDGVESGAYMTYFKTDFSDWAYSETPVADMVDWTTYKITKTAGMLIETYIGYMFN